MLPEVGYKHQQVRPGINCLVRELSQSGEHRFHQHVPVFLLKSHIVDNSLYTSEPMQFDETLCGLLSSSVLLIVVYCAFVLTNGPLLCKKRREITPSPSRLHC